MINYNKLTRDSMKTQQLYTKWIPFYSFSFKQIASLPFRPEWNNLRSMNEFSSKIHPFPSNSPTSSHKIPLFRHLYTSN